MPRALSVNDDWFFSNMTPCLIEDEASATVLSAHWIQRIADGERRGAYAFRDGRYLRRVPPSEHVDAKVAQIVLSRDLAENVALRRCAAEAMKAKEGTSLHRGRLDGDDVLLRKLWTSCRSCIVAGQNLPP